MKKLLLITLLVIIGFCVQAQESKTDTNSYDYYCQYWGQLMSNGWLKPMKIIWGNQRKEAALTDETGNALEFNNMTDVMNYFSKRGWMLDNVVVDNQNQWYYYIFKKRVTSDEEAKTGLYFTTDFPEKKKR